MQRMWPLEQDVDDEEVGDVESRIKELAKRKVKKRRLLRSLRGLPWARNAPDTVQWLGPAVSGAYPGVAMPLTLSSGSAPQYPGPTLGSRCP